MMGSLEQRGAGQGGGRENCGQDVLNERIIYFQLKINKIVHFTIVPQIDFMQVLCLMCAVCSSIEI